MNTLTVLGPLVPIVCAYCILAFNANKQNLSDTRGRQLYIDRLTHPKYELIYKAILQYGLSWVDWAFNGTKLFQPSSYVFCIAISFLYTLIGFIIAWAIGGPGKVGKTALLPENWSVFWRVLFTISLILVCVFLYKFTANASTIIRKSLAFVRSKVVIVPFEMQTVMSRLIVAAESGLLYWYTQDFVLLLLFLFSFAMLGFWLGAAVFFGGAVSGALAALFSGVGTEGTHRFVAAIAILAAVALGGSHGARPFAQLFTRYYRRSVRSMRAKRILEQGTDLLVFALVGATGGAAFVAGASRTYSAVVGSEIDVSSLETLGFPSSSPIFSAIGAVGGFIGGALAARLGRGAVFFSGFLSAVLLIATLGAAFEHGLYVFFGSQSFIGAALMNMLLFFIILPPINAVWDWLAWDISRGLGRNLLRRVTIPRILWHTFAAFGTGTILLFGLTWSAAGAIAVFNEWMLHYTGAVPLPIEDLATAAMADPLGPAGIWVTVMLFSTLLPTFCHFVFIAFGVLAVQTPAMLRAKLVGQVSRATSPAELDIAALYFTLLPLLGTLCVGLFTFISFVAFDALERPISGELYNSVKYCSSIVRTWSGWLW